MKQAGYSQASGSGWKRPDETILFDIYPGSRVYSTELLNSPLQKGGNKKIRQWDKIYLGTLNPVDLIISKMFRGDDVDIQDSLILLKHEKVNLEELKKRYWETAQYDVSEERVLRNLDRLLGRIQK